MAGDGIVGALVAYMLSLIRPSPSPMSLPPLFHFVPLSSLRRLDYGQQLQPCVVLTNQIHSEFRAVRGFRSTSAIRRSQRQLDDGRHQILTRTFEAKALAKF